MVEGCFFFFHYLSGNVRGKTLVTDVYILAVVL
jgi:hypothetical protein